PGAGALELSLLRVDVARQPPRRLLRAAPRGPQPARGRGRGRVDVGELQHRRVLAGGAAALRRPACGAARERERDLVVPAHVQRHRAPLAASRDRRRAAAVLAPRRRGHAARREAGARRLGRAVRAAVPVANDRAYWLPRALAPGVFRAQPPSASAAIVVQELTTTTRFV